MGVIGSRQYGGRLLILSRATMASSSLLALGLATQAIAQTVPAPPVRSTIDANGVDLFLGTMNVNGPALTIGQSEPQGMRYFRFNRGSGWSDNVMAALNQAGSLMTVSFGGVADSFTASGAVFTPTEGNGATLSLAGTVYTYTRADGTIIHFDATLGTAFSPFYSNAGRATDIASPDGRKLNYTYDLLAYCRIYSVTEPGFCQKRTKVYRIATVRSNYGYRLAFSYPVVTPADIEYTVNDAVVWGTPYGVSANNLAAAGAPGAPQSFSDTSITDALGRTTNFRMQGSRVLGITHPGHAVEDVTVNYLSGVGTVASVTRSSVTSTYAFVDAGGVRTTTVTDPLAQATVYTFNIASQRMLSLRDPLNRTTSWTYDASGRLTQASYPEGNKAQYIYDARGNVTQTRNISKTPGTPPDIVTSAVYPASCTNIATCNSPTSTTDAKGYITDYTYDATHGGALSVTAPAATAGGTRPQSRFGYTSMQAYFDTGGGSIVASGQPVYQLTSTSTCQTTASCTGGADEVKSTFNFGPQVAGTGNNLLPVSATNGSGDGALTATTAITYDSIGNLVLVDGPLAGAADTSRIRYDAARQVIGAASPSPGNGQPNRAQRSTYNPDGQVTLSEAGTVTDQSDAAWSAFSSQQQVAITYDANARPIKQEVKAGGTTYALSQTSYDALGRVDCAVQRMDAAQWNGQTNACTPQTSGPNGPDRVGKTLYNAASEVTTVQVAVGTADQANEVSNTFTLNGRQATVTDGENNRTTYEYDGFDRGVKTRYPAPAQGALASSTTDFEQATYDANSNVTQRRLRDGQLINYTFDNLNRATLKDVPNTVYYEFDKTYNYDLLGRLTSAVDSSGTYSFGYDALGRQVSEAVTGFGSKLSQYDLAGRRTRLTHADGLFFTYDYLVTGEVSAIRENGAASGVGVLGTYAYDSLGRRTTLTRGNGTVTSYAFDPVSRLSSLSQDLAGTAQDVTIGTFTYNPASQIMAQTRSNDSYAWNSHYNVNRNYTVNGINQPVAAGATTSNGASSITYGFDGRGNLTSSGSSTFAYTSENRMAGAGATNLGYDALGRLGHVSASTFTYFDYDGSRLVLERASGGGAVQRRYVYGPGEDEPLVWYEGAGTTDRRWLHADERGSVIAVTNASGAALAINRYDEYGIPASTNLGRFQYTGQTWLPELGMYYYKARIYSPTLGRFMQTDPIGYGDGVNWYNYVGSDPVNASDPSGLVTEHNPYVHVDGTFTGTLLGRPCDSCVISSSDGPAASSPSAGGHSPGGGGGVGGRGGNSSSFVRTTTTTITCVRGCAVGDGSSFSISIDSPLSGPVGTGRGISGATGGGAASGGESSSRNDGSEIVVTARPVHVAPAIAAALAVGEVALAGAVIGGVAETGREAYEVYKGTRKSISKANIASAAVAGSCGAVIGMIPGGLVVKIFKGIGAFTICATFAKEVIDSNPDGR